MKPFLLVLSSPSGGGKTTIARRLLTVRNDVAYSVSATTRKQRPGEEPDRDYHFLSREEFERLEAGGAFIGRIPIFRQDRGMGGQGPVPALPRAVIRW